MIDFSFSSTQVTHPTAGASETTLNNPPIIDIITTAQQNKTKQYAYSSDIKNIKTYGKDNWGIIFVSYLTNPCNTQACASLPVEIS